jgi:PPE-repeat protein
MNFSVLPPEVNSALMFSGAGSAPIMAAAGVGTKYAGWLSAAATQAEQAACQAKAVVAVFDAAEAAIVHPLEVAANRAGLVQLVTWNLFGQNAPAIAAAEAG